MSRKTLLFHLVSNATAVLLRHFLAFFIPVIPYLLDDTRRLMESWGASGNFDPFDNIYEVGITFLTV